MKQSETNNKEPPTIPQEDVSIRQKLLDEKEKHLAKKLHKKTHKGTYTTHSLKIERTFDSEKGKVVRKLYIEKELVNPIKRKLQRRIYEKGKSAVSNKIRENETDSNVGITAIRTGLENSSSVVSTSKQIYSLYEAQKIKRIKKEIEKVSSNKEQYRQRKQQEPSTKKQAQKKMQKKRIQKKKLNERKVKAAQKTTKSITKGSFNILTHVLKGKSSIAICGIAFLVLFLLNLLSVFFVLFLGTSSGISECWLSDEVEIEKVELEYTRMEAQLEEKIENIERLYPGYDRYEYSVGRIEHNPFELINYLSAKYEEFTYEEVRNELAALFERQYQLSTKSTTIQVEQQADDGTEDAETEITEETVLYVNLDVSSLGLFATDFSNNPDAKELYEMYTENHGGLQYLKTPLDLDWYSYIGSYYGYEYSGTTTLDCGLTMMCPSKSEITAMASGIVTRCENAGKFGNYVQVKCKDIIINYAHLEASKVAVGDYVKEGQEIAISKGNLYIEIIQDETYINPLFYIEDGEGEYPGYIPQGSGSGPDISLVPGVNEDKVWHYLKGIGFSNAGAAAVMGNIACECSFNPSATNGNLYFGICQWGGGRWCGNTISLSSYAASKGTDWTDLQTQLEFFNLECSKSYGHVYTQMKKADDVVYAADYFCVYYEGCVGTGSNNNWKISAINGKPYQDLYTRIENAKKYYNLYAA